MADMHGDNLIPGRKLDDPAPAHPDSVDPHDTQPPGADGLSVKAGHEPDRFKTRSALYVPLLVLFAMAVAFTVVTATFYYLTVKPPVDAAANPAALADSQKPINARFAAISSTDPNARTPQPRLEYLKQTAGNDNPSDPPFYRSKRPVEAVGATWEIRPEDLRPENFVDPTLRRKILVEAGWQDDAKKVAHIPIAEAMAAVVAQHKLAAVKDAKPLPTTSDGKPKLSNSGRGGPAQQASPASPPAAGGKKDDHGHGPAHAPTTPVK